MLDLVTQNPYFGLVISLLFFILFSKLSARFHVVILNPLLFTIIAIILVLSLRYSLGELPNRRQSDSDADFAGAGPGHRREPL